MAERISMSDDYVTRAGWLRTAGRSDLVDEIADQFERPTQPPAVAGHAADHPEENTVRWPRRARGWRCEDRLHPSVFERRAAG